MAGKTYYATRDFKDSGTKKRFERGKAVEAAEGEIANYVAAGLVSDTAPAPEKAPAADKAKG